MTEITTLNSSAPSMSANSANKPTSSTALNHYLRPNESSTYIVREVVLNELDALERSNGWLKIKPAKTVQAWVERNNISLVGNLALIERANAPAYLLPVSRLAQISTAGRSGSGTAQNYVAQYLPKGKMVIASDRDENWVQVTPLKPINLWLREKDLARALLNKREQIATTASQANTTNRTGLNSKSSIRPSALEDDKKNQIANRRQTNAAAPLRAPSLKDDAQLATANGARPSAPRMASETIDLTSRNSPDRLNYTRWLCQQGSSNKTLQLASFSDSGQMEKFYSNNREKLPGDLFKVTSLDGKWHYLVFGSYSNDNNADYARRSIGMPQARIRQIGHLQSSRCS